MNSATLYGTLIQQPELRYTSSDQKPICTTYVQFVERTKEAANATLKAVAFGKVADALHSIPCGAKVVMEGALRMNKMSTPEGNRTVPEFIINRLEPFNSQPQITSVSQKTVEVEASEVEEDDDIPY
jgi:single-stranded DNA-binding protein